MEPGISKIYVTADTCVSNVKRLADVPAHLSPKVPSGGTSIL